LSGRVAFSLANRDHGGVAVGIDIEAVVARFLDGERQIRRVNFVYFSLEQMPHMQVQRPLMKFNLNAVVGDVSHREAGLVSHPQNACANVEFRSRLLVAPNVVGIGQRTIYRSLNPIPISLGLNRNGSRHIL
jgi:hypothetical protein